MNKATLVARLLLGLLFFFFGLNGFFHFLPVPPMSEKAGTFFAGMVATGYFLPLLAGTQVVCGALLLAGAFVPLALIVLAPVILNIVLFHIFVDTAGLPMALAIGCLETFLAFFSKPYSEPIKQLFCCDKMCKKN
jgi:putative oxidoreductase